MDLLIHLPTMEMKRNFGRGTEARLTKAVGTDEWTRNVSGCDSTGLAYQPLVRRPQ